LQQHGAAGNSYADLVRLQCHGGVHLVHTPLPELAAGLHVTLLKRRPGLKREAAAVPHQRLGMFRVVGQCLLAGVHGFLQAGLVARESGEEIGADEIVEPLIGELLLRR
jgi:hypothetical protein